MLFSVLSFIEEVEGVDFVSSIIVVLFSVLCSKIDEGVCSTLSIVEYSFNS